jgi:RimJ/RimL family protein N-acetyltransferase
MSGTTRSPEMETERLHLRPFTADDVAAIHRVYSDSEVMQYVSGGPVADLAGTEAMLREYGDQEAAGYSFWAVIERAGGEVLGDAGLDLLEGRGPEVELGYTIGRAWWGQGYAGIGSRPGEERHAARRTAHGVRPRTPSLQTSGRLL